MPHPVGGAMGVTLSHCAPLYSLVPRPNPLDLTRKGSGVTSLNSWACGSVEAL